MIKCWTDDAEAGDGCIFLCNNKINEFEEMAETKIDDFAKLVHNKINDFV